MISFLYQITWQCTRNFPGASVPRHDHAYLGQRTGNLEHFYFCSTRGHEDASMRCSAYIG